MPKKSKKKLPLFISGLVRIDEESSPSDEESTVIDTMDSELSPSSRSLSSPDSLISIRSLSPASPENPKLDKLKETAYDILNELEKIAKSIREYERKSVSDKFISKYRLKISDATDIEKLESRILILKERYEIRKTLRHINKTLDTIQRKNHEFKRSPILFNSILRTRRMLVDEKIEHFTLIYLGKLLSDWIKIKGGIIREKYEETRHISKVLHQSNMRFFEEKSIKTPPADQKKLEDTTLFKPKKP